MKICLANLHEATEQQVLDQCVNHMLTQMKRSVMDMGGCAYRGFNGLMCVAGSLIADNEYKPEMDTGGDEILDTTWNDLVARGEVPSHHSYLIGELQQIHDNVSVEFWEEKLKLLAEDEGLEFNWKGSV